MSSPTTELLPPSLLAQLERLELVTRKIFRGRTKGERRSKRKGQSVEFADFRPYVSGDDLRHIDWNLYARLDRLFLKMFLEEEDLRLHVLIDDSESMNFGSPTKFFFAKQLAAALAFIGLVRADQVRVETTSQPLNKRSNPYRGRASVWRLQQELENLSVNGNTSLAEGVRKFCLRTTGQGVVVLISDLLDKQGFDVALRYLTNQNFDVYVLQVLAPEELDPQIAGDLKLVDCEDDDITEISVSAPLLDRYRATLAAFVASARESCHRRGMTHLLSSSGAGVEQLVLNFLRRRGLVR